ncbi:MAG: M20 family metallopeptidase [Terriglobia bacterium]
MTLKNREGQLNPKELLDYCQGESKALLQCLREAVEIESPSTSKPDVDGMAAFFAGWFRRSGGKAKILEAQNSGAAVVAEFWGGKRGSRPLLLLGHTDTVWEVGTLRTMPFRMAKGRAYGPGIFDMKSGIVCAVWALRALRALKITPQRAVRFFLNPDEEIASHAFRRRLLAEGNRAHAVLVLEPSANGGALKTARKGVGEFRITVHGRSAHAGINPAAGVNAISELARQLVKIEGFASQKEGLTLTVGAIEGGTRTNVVPEEARAAIDVRILRACDRQWIERRVYGLRPFHPEARLEIQGGVNRPPLEHKMAAGLFKRAEALARSMGMNLTEASTGGGSDGNFTAALGVPTLDGLGGVGDGAHARHEHVVMRELPRRAALLAALIATL